MLLQTRYPSGPSVASADPRRNNQLRLGYAAFIGSCCLIRLPSEKMLGTTKEFELSNVSRGNFVDIVSPLYWHLLMKIQLNKKKIKTETSLKISVKNYFEVSGLRTGREPKPEVENSLQE